MDGIREVGFQSRNTEIGTESLTVAFGGFKMERFELNLNRFIGAPKFSWPHSLMHTRLRLQTKCDDSALAYRLHHSLSNFQGTHFQKFTL